MNATAESCFGTQLAFSTDNQPPTGGGFTPTRTENDSMLRIAVPLLNKRVAPYFGCCDELLLLDQEGSALRRTCQSLSADDPWHISRQLAGMGVQKVVCGGIWSLHKDWLTAHGIEVIENQHGSVEAVVGWVLRGTMDGPNMQATVRRKGCCF